MIYEEKFPPSKPPQTVSLSSKPECLTKIWGCFRNKKKHNQAHRQLICEFKRTLMKKPSVPKKLLAHVNGSLQNVDSASQNETQANESPGQYVLWLLYHLPIHNPKLSWMIRLSKCPVRLVGKNFNPTKNGARQDVSFNCRWFAWCGNRFRDGFLSERIFPSWNSPHLQSQLSKI